MKIQPTVAAALAMGLAALLFSCGEDSNGPTDPAPADSTAPAVSITFPADGDTLVDDTTILATAEDNAGGAGVTEVTFLVDGTEIGRDSLPPYEATWPLPPPELDNGHLLEAHATDGAGNVGHSNAILVHTLWSGDALLEDALAAAGPGEYDGRSYARYIELDPAVTYVAYDRVLISTDTCIRGGGTLIDLRRSGSLRVGSGAQGDSTRLHIDHCLVLYGSIPAYEPFGGALEYMAHARGAVVNNTFYGCEPAALYIHGNVYNPHLRIFNNILFRNNQGILHHDSQSGLLWIRYNDSVGNQVNFGVHCGCPSTPIGDELPFDGVKLHMSNFSLDPHFVQEPNPPRFPVGDFHLLPGSPCRGAGESQEDLGAYPFTE